MPYVSVFSLNFSTCLLGHTVKVQDTISIIAASPQHSTGTERAEQHSLHFVHHHCN